MPTVGQITSLFVRKVVAQVSDSLDHAALLRSVGINPDSAVDPKQMIADGDYYGLLERISIEDPNAVELPLRTGGSMRCADYGAFGLAFKSALSLRGSYERSQRYARILTSVSTYDLEETDEGIWMRHYRDGDGRKGLLMSNEATLASVITISREVSTADVSPRRACFRHSAPASTVAHERFFGCEVVFDADGDALLFSKEVLDTPNRVGDASISKFFDTHLEEELARFDDDSSLEHRVRIQISQSLSEGIPKISDISRRLGMSGRTLQRRLSDQGHSFQTLVEEARRQLAERLLRQTQYSLAEIAYLTGFSEQSAFTRAFKRWAGQTPRSYRLQATTPL